ncbi:MAG: YHYH protein [Bacteroidia bacterium]|nr:YHYH protein [Bacteroidia bacterium]
MRKIFIFLTITALGSMSYGQLSPAITSWLQNTTETGSYYMAGNSSLIPNNILVNCQKVEYSADYVYVNATGVPAYPTGPFQDGNPSQAQDQAGLYRIPLNPQENTGALIETNPGKIGLFINGVALYDYRDGVAWNPTSNNICGGPGNPMCPGGPGASQAWNRDAIPAERAGFDCSKGHPAMGDYHHHQNPSAFKLDLNVISTVCNLYDADGLYTLDSATHSPLIGFAYDGFPIYGAYGYKNSDGSGGITRIKSGYQLRNITSRTTWADGTDVDDGPDVDATYFLGYFREDYEFISNPAEEDYLDEHNGRFCVTPEYPNGTYAYFATVDENWNSAYPYVVGPTFYGVAENRSVASITETTTVYTSSTNVVENIFDELNLNIFPNPSSDLIAIQVDGLLHENLEIELLDMTGKKIKYTTMREGSTISYFDVQTVYEGTYLLSVRKGKDVYTQKILIKRN